ncbi:MAG: SLATT domain-containing protein [Bacteroidota bacterium]
MKKKEWANIARSRKWVEIGNQCTADYLNCVLTYADEMHKFYFEHVEGKRVWSVVLRVGSIIFFTAALILTLTIGYTDDANEFLVLTMNIAALAIASTLLLVDRQFGFSEGWMRYTQAQFEIEKVVSEYHAQLISIEILQKEGEEIRKLQIDTIVNFDKSLRIIVIDETSNWSTYLRNQINILTTKVDSELAKARQKLEQTRVQMATKKKEANYEKERSKRKGVLIITFNYQNIKSGNLIVDGTQYIIKSMQNDKVIDGLPQRIHIVTGIIKLAESEIPFERAIKIVDGINELVIG